MKPTIRLAILWREILSIYWNAHTFNVCALIKAFDANVFKASVLGCRQSSSPYRSNGHNVMDITRIYTRFQLANCSETRVSIVATGRCFIK